MSRFLLARDAQRDLDEIKLYLDHLPAAPAFRIAKELQAMFDSIAQHPFLGSIQSQMTRITGKEVRTRVCGSYRILYRPSEKVTEILGILHTAQDISTIMSRRLQ